MRAVYLRRYGPPDVLEVAEAPEPSAGPGQLLVGIEAVGVNYAEVLSRLGLYGWTPKRPYVLGMECVGRVEAVGAGVEGRAVGESVLVGTKSGAYAERIAVHHERALPAVQGFTLEENAAFGVQYMTAWVSLVEMARIRPSDRVLVSAAAGGVGTAAVQIAKAAGCEVVALAGSNEKLAVARRLGADRGVSYGAPGFADRLRAELGARGADVALETVGGDVYAAVVDALAPFGRVVVAGYAGLRYRLWNPRSWWRAWRGKPRMSLETMYRGSKGLMSTHLGYLLADRERLRRVWDDLVGFVTAHGIRPVVGHVLGLDDVAEAHRLMESRKSVGKIVLRV